MKIKNYTQKKGNCREETKRILFCHHRPKHSPRKIRGTCNVTTHPDNVKNRWMIQRSGLQNVALLPWESACHESSIWIICGPVDTSCVASNVHMEALKKPQRRVGAAHSGPFLNSYMTNRFQLIIRKVCSWEFLENKCLEVYFMFSQHNSSYASWDTWSLPLKFPGECVGTGCNFISLFRQAQQNMTNKHCRVFEQK